MIEGLISTYGYAAIAIGTFFEGEVVLVLGGVAAFNGYLDLYWVMFWSFVGSLCGDQLYYYIGKTKGESWLNNRPKLKHKSEVVFRQLEKHQIWVILLFRFVIGFRMITPFLVGISNIPAKRFFFLNMIGAFAWAIVISYLGYWLGQAVENVIGEVRRYELFAFLFLAVMGTAYWLWRLYTGRDEEKTMREKQ